MPYFLQYEKPYILSHVRKEEFCVKWICQIIPIWTILWTQEASEEIIISVWFSHNEEINLTVERKKNLQKKMHSLFLTYTSVSMAGIDVYIKTIAFFYSYLVI